MNEFKKNVTCRQPQLEKVENTRIFSQVTLEYKYPIKETHILITNYNTTKQQLKF